uniref:Alkenone desaturase 1 n=1 Tax=Tisochrysis lutea TaxID=1321669 RepID=A0A3G9DKL2_9EUKA|nr:alkenone desaturase 1 [Tisochrysis lutea]
MCPNAAAEVVQGRLEQNEGLEEVELAEYRSDGKGPFSFFAREYELMMASLHNEAVMSTPAIVGGCPPPAPIWAGLRPYIIMAPVTMLVPPVYLISCLHRGPLLAAFLVATVVASANYLLKRNDDVVLAKHRTPSPYSSKVNPIQGLFLVVFLPVWSAATFAGIFCSSVSPQPLLSLVCFCGLLFFKNGICMSVILHRYCAHAAFKCHWATSLCLGVISCFSYQGGPLWWASRHRAHHKFCDTTLRDPHSPALNGIINAFSFFLSGTTADCVRSIQAVDEEFAPCHIDTPCMRLIDSLSFVFPLIEFHLALAMFGPAGLWVSFSSSWIGQVSTLWFNVRNHPIGGSQTKLGGPPPEHHKHRRTSTTNVNCDAVDKPTTIDSSPLYIFLDYVSSILSPAVGEDDHDHHHTHPALAVRPGFDAPQYFIHALAQLGLVWNVQQERKVHGT